jgi:DNA-binding transcriptional MerR regulator
MRIGELSRRSGVPIPTIKYYLREGLLPPGASTAANQATYDEEHLRRLRLIRALVDVGGVSVAATRDVVEALSGTGLDLMTLFGIVHEAVIPRRRPDAQAREQAAAVVAAHGWNVHPESSSLDLLADALAAVAALEVTTILDRLDTYAELARTLAAAEVDSVLGQPDDAQRLESVVLGTVLGERVFSALRLLAHQHESARRLDPAGGRLDRAKDGSPRG